MKDFHLYIEYFLRRPAMYGINKIEDLYFIIAGATFFSTGQTSETISAFQTGFRKFTNKHFGTVKKDYDSVRLIRLHSGSDKHSLELFEMLYDQYMKSKKLKRPIVL